jgi:diguanylate cyclase (GGDEF)-like protein/PAS domain S-box-containing protein
MLARLGVRDDELTPDRPEGPPPAQADGQGRREPRPLGARCAWAYLAVGIIPAIIYFLPHGPLGHHALYDGIGLSCVAVSVYGVRRNRPPNAIAWYLFALGQLAFVSGDLIRAYYEVVVGGSAPFPGFADVAYIAAYPILTASLVLLVRSRDGARDRANFIDVMIIVTSAGLLSWVYLIEPQIHNPGHLGWVGMAISILYPLFDLLLLGVAARLMLGSGARHTSYYLLCGSLLSLLVADSAYTMGLLDNTYHTGSPADIGYLASYLLCGAAALHPSIRKVAQRTSAQTMRITPKRLAFLTAVTLLAPCVRILSTLRGTDLPPLTTVIPTVILFVLVMTRMSGLVKSLSRALDRHEEAERRRRQSEARFGSLVEHSSDIVIVMDGAGVIIYQSPSVMRVLGYDRDALLARPFMELVHEHDRDATVSILSDTKERTSASPAVLTFRCRHHEGSWRYVETTFTNLLADPTVGGIVLNARDVTEQVALQSQLSHQAFHDPLTDLANRVLFRDRVEHALQRRTSSDHSVAVLFLDIDNFKRVNDSLGHSAGDELLVAFADRLRGCTRAADTPARLGGDEFAVLLDEPTDAESAAARLKDLLTTGFLVASTEVFLTVSVGISISDGLQSDADELLRNADAAMYAAKGRGKATAVVFRPQMHQAALERLELEGELRRAVEEHEFRVHYQPIVAMSERRAVGFEALVRWAHPERGLLGPGQFISAAEESGLIRDIGRIIVAEATCQAQAWRGTFNDPHLSVSVNLSAPEFARADLVDDVRAALDHSGLDPTCLVLEMTESVLMSDTETTMGRLKALKDLGVRLSVDDFGTGFSSFGYLRRFPIDELKIAKPFLDRIPEDPQEIALVRGMLELAHSINLRVVAEGVERQEQWDALDEMGCDLVQGYLIARPQGPERMNKLIESLSPAASGNGDVRTPPADVPLSVGHRSAMSALG